MVGESSRADMVGESSLCCHMLTTLNKSTG